MTSRADLDRYSGAANKAVDLARRDLRKFWNTLDLSHPEEARDELLEFLPRLTAVYGDVVGAAAAEWYEDLRAEIDARTYNAVLSDGVGVDQVQATTRYAAGHLFMDDPLQTLLVLNGSLQRFVQYSGRDTIARNAEHDPRKPRFARVPQGAKTCAWCSMLASRGWVYLTDESAGLHEHWHDECDCQVVPEWDRDQTHIDGYDPDHMYSLYMDARKAANAAGAALDDNNIAAYMRRMFPGDFSDGIAPAL